MPFNSRKQGFRVYRPARRNGTAQSRAQDNTSAAIAGLHFSQNTFRDNDANFESHSILAEGKRGPLRLPAGQTSVLTC